jgi:ankyrin repeat protein
MKRGLIIVATLIVLLLLGGGWMLSNSPDALNQQLVRAIQDKQSAAQLEALLARGANPNYIDSTSLQPSLLEKINSAVAGVETARPGFGITLLTMACAQGNDAAIDALLKHGANPNLEASADAPLWLAIQGQNLSLVKRLLDHGADPDRKLREYNNMTARQLAEEQKNPEQLALFKNASPPQ